MEVEVGRIADLPVNAALFFQGRELKRTAELSVRVGYPLQ